MYIVIPKGKHYDPSLTRAYYRFLPFCYKRNKVITFNAKILTEPYDIRPDADQLDQHKLCGINLSFWKESNVNAIMTSFQANPKDGTWDIYPYVNVNRNFVPGVRLFQSKPGDSIRSEFKLINRNTIHLSIYHNDEPVISNPYSYRWNDAKVRYPALILPYHGGKDNDGNGIGGVAPIDIHIELDIKK